MKKIAVIAIQHPTEPNLFLHGLRRDNQKWACAGGHCHPGETDHESASRELEEETGLKGVKIEKVHEKVYGQNHIVLFHGVHPEGQELNAKEDPDKEFVTFKFLDPRTHGHLHVPGKNNIVNDWLGQSLVKHSPGYEAETEIIKENKLKPEAHKRHNFKPAKWTFPNGHPRCLVCGDEERIGGVCEGRSLKKDQPVIKFPKVPNIPTRLDQEIMPIPSGQSKQAKRQKEIGLRAYLNRTANATGRKPDIDSRYVAGTKKVITGIGEAGKHSDAKKRANPGVVITPGKQGETLHGAATGMYSTDYQARLIPGRSVQEHEAAHLLMHHVAKQYGEEAAQKVVGHVLSHFHVDDRNAMYRALTGTRGYKNSPNIQEEMMNHMRDYLTDPVRREYLNKKAEKQGAKLDHGRMKTSWKHAMQYLKGVTPEWLKSDASDRPALEAKANQLKPSAAIPQPEKLAASIGKIKVEPFAVDPSNFNPRKHDFIVRYQHGGKQVGFMAVTHKKDGIMPFNMEVKKNMQRKGIASEMAKHAQRLSGKKMIHSPDMTDAGRAFLDKFTGMKSLKKMEVIHNEDSSSLMNRDETKHFMPKENLDKLLNGIKSELPDGDPDTSARFNVNQTIYLDNMDLDALRDNMERHKPRFKVRIRRYSPNGNQWEDVAYVELKLKTKDGETKKVRVRIREEHISDVCEGKPIRVDEDMEKLNVDIPKDILWKRCTSINTILEKYGFKKQIVVTYQRRAFSSPDLRVTIDDSIRYHDAHDISPDAKSMIEESSYFKAFKKRHMKVRKQDYVIVEVKEEKGIPGWLKDILKECDAKEVSFSKYCGAMVSFMVSGGEEGVITRNRKIDSNSVLAAIEGYEVFNKAEETLQPQDPPVPLVLQYPVSIAGKTTKMTVKNFGNMNEIDHMAIRSIIDGEHFHEPINDDKLIFKPHVLKGVDGTERYVLLVYGAPQRVMNMKGSTPYIPIDRDLYEHLSPLGPAFNSANAHIKFHPAELKAGDQVLQTY